MDAFVDLGVENVIGNIWSVYDEPSKELAITFYNRLMKGDSFGTALSFARLKLAKGKTFQEITTWAAPVLYGSPSNSV